MFRNRRQRNKYMNRNILGFVLTALTGMASINASAQTQVAVFSVNDFHGAFVRNDAKGIAGAPAVLQTLDSLKTVYPFNVTVSAGDLFGGSYFYNATKGVLMPEFLDNMDITLSALGNHEFDDGQDALAAKWESSFLRPRDWDISYVCANVRNNQTHAVPAFAKPSATRTITLPNGKDFTVGFVGLIASSTPQQVSVRRIKGLSFDGNYTAVLDSVMRLPEGAAVRKANLRLLLTHVGSRMNNQTHQPEWDDKDAANLQQINDRSLWHGIISSHSHQPVCGTINESQLPIVQGRWHGDYISMLLCTIDNNTLEVTKVEPRLVRVTPKQQLEPAAAQLQAQIDTLLAKTKTAGGTPIGTVLTTVSHNMVHDRDNKYCFSEVGTLVCKAYAEAFRHSERLNANTPVIGCSHFGSIRAGFVKGSLSVLDVGETLPFSNPLKAYIVTGKQLKALVQFGLHNQRFGWLQTGNLDIVKDTENNVVRLAYVSPTGKHTPLTDLTQCYLVADEFITNGGDGYDANFFKQLRQVDSRQLPATTDAFISYLKNRTL